jgi:hypothetical protein
MTKFGSPRIVDLAAAEEWPRFRCIDAVGAELQAGKSGVKHNDCVGHGESLRRLAQHAVRAATLRVKQHGTGREAARGDTIRPAGQDNWYANRTPAVSASAMKRIQGLQQKWLA